MRLRCLLLAAVLAVGAGAMIADRASAQGSPEYQKKCKAAGVPLPPAFTATGPDGKTPLWTNKGKLNNALNFDLIGPDADPGDISAWKTEVLVYNDPKTGGICFALPRGMKDSDQVELLGIICQSKPVETGGKQAASACFFDNINLADPTMRIIQPLKDIGEADIKKFQGGDKLEENCTLCHRGNNAFQVVPNTPEQQDSGFEMSSQNDGDQTSRYVPIGQPGWVNPPSPKSYTIGTTEYKLSSPGSGCQSCHNIPRVTLQYCQQLIGVGIPGMTVRTGILDATYPAGGPKAGKYLMPPGASKRSPEEQRDIDTLKAVCKGLGYNPAKP